METGYTFDFKGYHFVQTCSACPEQYDVFDENGNQVAYVRLRWGCLYAECPDLGGTEVYSAGIGNDAGCFRSESERKNHLRRITDRIEFYNQIKKLRCPYCGEPLDIYLYNCDEFANHDKSVFDCYECTEKFTVIAGDDGLIVKKGE